MQAGLTINLTLNFIKMYVAFRRWASLSLLFLFFCIHTGYDNTVNRYPIIPLPKKLIERTEYFPIRIGTKIEINDRVGEGALQQLQQATLSLFSLSLKKTKGQAEKGNIVFAFNENLKESGQYTIDIDSGRLLIDRKSVV